MNRHAVRPIPSPTARAAAPGLLVASLLALAGPAPSQRELATLRGGPSAGMGYRLAALGDIDGDGVDDLAVAAPFDDPLFQYGLVTVHSGGTGPGIAYWSGGQGGAHAGSALAAAGDVDGDGRGDLLIGIPGEFGTGQVVLLSGATGRVVLDLSQYPTGNVWHGTGSLVAGAGDVDRDGTPDLLTFDSYRGESTVWLISGKPILGARQPVVPSTLVGFPPALFESAAGLGDVDGDGWPDIGAAGTGGLCYVISGRLLKPMMLVHGHRIAAAGDLDGDGRDDFLITQLDAGGPSRVVVYTGINGQVVQTLSSPAGTTTFGLALAGGRDLDDDGTPDFAIGDPGAGQVFVYSGGDGSLLYTLDGEAPGDGFGTAIAMLRDIDGDRLADLAIGAPQTNAFGLPLGDGYVRVVSGAPRGSYGNTERLTAGAAGCQDLHFRGPRELAGEPYLVLGSLSGTAPGLRIGERSLMLNPDGYLFSLLSPSLPPQVFGDFRGSLDARAEAVAHFCLPAFAARYLAGSTFHHAFVVLGGSGIRALGDPIPLTLMP